MSDADKLANVRRELDLLEGVWRAAVPQAMDLSAEERALTEVNAKLWDVEDRLRELESMRHFGEEFVELARAVYFTNDDRAAIKKRINLALGSALVEEKSYQQYR